MKEEFDERHSISGVWGLPHLLWGVPIARRMPRASSMRSPRGEHQVSLEWRCSPRDHRRGDIFPEREDTGTAVELTDGFDHEIPRFMREEDVDDEEPS